MPPAAASERRGVSRGTLLRPRQGDCVPLHPLLSSYKKQTEKENSI